jgi:acyl carrier protein
MHDEDILRLIKQTLCSIVPEQTDRFSKLTLTTPVKQLDIDSISTTEMIGQIEDALGTTFDEHDLANVKTLGDIAKLIHHVNVR